jgi:hypothetical protein
MSCPDTNYLTVLGHELFILIQIFVDNLLYPEYL